MTMDQDETTDDLMKLNANLARIEALSTRLVAALSQKQSARQSLESPGHELYLKAARALMEQMMADPAKMMQHQITFWSDTLRYAAEMPEQADSKGDRRFASPLWEASPYYKFVKAQYLAAADATQTALDDLEGLDERDKKRVSYFARQIIDMFAPSNFLPTNPEAMARAVQTEGQSLVDGLENMVRDLEAHGGELSVTLCDPEAFEVGKNLATSEGSVVFRNELFELIQYAPRSEKVHSTPLIIFPPWINKYYILDMKENNSLIRWLTGQGFTLFVVSWVNPDASMADTGVDTYVEQGFLPAIKEVKAICRVKAVNVTGYCIGGTTLALTLALLQKRGDKSVKSATFFTTLTDFAEPGEVGVFLEDDFLVGIEEEVSETGYLDSRYMARTFSYLRANDLVYAPAVKRYLLGQAPPAFDLLHWNGDGTNLPARMAVEYLRNLCQKNTFAGAGYAILGEKVTLADVKTPLCAIACETDHIAPWKSSYDGIRAMGASDKTFILSESGHIAGIVNPPSKLKYGHYTGVGWPESAEKWLESATFNKGSWWDNWGKWLATHSGRKVDARVPGENGVEILAAAPGTYVSGKPVS